MAQRHVLVKVGEGKHLSFNDASLGMTSGALLVALAGTRAFEVELRDVALSECAVRVCASASKRAPSEQEAAAARGLEGAETLGDVAADLAGNLFVHVQLPAAVAAAAAAAAGVGAGGESIDAQLGCSGCASRERDWLSSIPALRFCATIPATAALAHRSQPCEKALRCQHPPLTPLSPPTQPSRRHHRRTQPRRWRRVCSRRFSPHAHPLTARLGVSRPNSWTCVRRLRKCLRCRSGQRSAGGAF